MLDRSGDSTPPTQFITWAHVTLRVGGVVVAAAARGPFADRDAVADDDFHYDKLEYTLQEVEEWRRLRHLATHADKPDRGYVLHRDVRPVLKRVELAAYDVLLNKLNWSTPNSRRRDIWYPSGILPDGHHAVAWVNSSSIKLHAYSLFDGFGAYPYDRSCKVRSHPPDWWLDTTFPIKGQIRI
jgi:hypothetical protein